jgi:hypothetical protein
LNGANPLVPEKAYLKPHLPMDAIGFVGLAWTLSDSDSEDVKWARSYLEKLLMDYAKDENAVDLLRALIPEVQGVAAKIKTARLTIKEDMRKYDEIKEAKIHGIEDLLGVGKGELATITRLLEIGAGGALGGFTSLITGNNTNDWSPYAYVLLGILVGYTATELIMRLYKIKKVPMLLEHYRNKKENDWDKYFIAETHSASVKLYNDASEKIKELYEEYDPRTRRISDDHQRMTRMFMERSMLKFGGIVDYYLEALLYCSRIENEFIEFIEDKKFTEEFKLYREEQGKDKQTDPNNCGFRSLARFLLSKQIVVDKEILDAISWLRDKRKDIVERIIYEEMKNMADFRNKAKDVFEKIDLGLKQNR